MTSSAVEVSALFSDADLRVLASGIRKVLATEWPRDWGLAEIARGEASWEDITSDEIAVMERLDALRSAPPRA